MSKDDIIVSNLNERIAGFFEHREYLNEDLQARMMQRNVNAMNGDLTGIGGFAKRNKLSVGAGADYLASSLQNRFTNPQYLMSVLPSLGKAAMSGAQRATAEREERQLQKEQRELNNEQKKVQKEAENLQKEEARQAATNEAISPNLANFADQTVGRIYDWGANVSAGGSKFLAGKATGSNVHQFTGFDPLTGKNISLNVATDTRNISQRRADALADIGKGVADQYVQNAIDAGLHKVSDMVGYGAAKAKFAIEDMKAKKAQAKLEAQRLREQKLAIKQQKP